MFSNVQIVGSQLDISNYSAVLAPKVSDPTDQPKATKASRPEAAAETEGPHRYTVIVPKDDGTLLNLGQGVGQIQTGIGMFTSTTIQSYVAKSSGNFTSLVLGAPSLAGSAANLATAGYSLTTEGASVHEAKGEVILRSFESNVGIAANQGVTVMAGGLLSMSAAGGYSLETPKSLKITAGEPSGPVQASWQQVLMSIPSFVGTVADFIQPAAAAHSSGAGDAVETVGENAGYLDFLCEGGEELHDSLLQKHASSIDKVLTHLATIAGIVLAAAPMRDEVKAGETIMGKVKPALDWGKTVYEEIQAIIADLKAADAEENAGCVSISAAKNVDVQAEEAVSIAGYETSINGFKSFSASGISASLKGHKDGSVWGGMTASLKALGGEVAIASDLGNVSIGGRKEVKMTSSKDAAVVTGKRTAQLNSTDEWAYVHGKQGVAIGSGGGTGGGVVLEEDKAWFGIAKGTDQLGSQAVKGAHLLTDGFGASLRATDSTDSSLALMKSKATLKSTAVVIDAETTLTVNASKILLG